MVALRRLHRKLTLKKISTAASPIISAGDWPIPLYTGDIEEDLDRIDSVKRRGWFDFCETG